MKRFIPLLSLVALLCMARSGSSAEPSAGPMLELDAILTRLSEKLGAGRKSREALQEELNALGELREKYRDRRDEPVARIRYMEGIIYLEVLEDAEKGLELLEGVQRDYPDTVHAGLAARKATVARIRKQLVVGKPFPAFEVRALDDQSVSLADFEGKVVLLDFWATWCLPCVAELPVLTRLHGKYGEKGFEILGISLDQNLANVEMFLEKRRVPWSQVCDGRGFDSGMAVKFGVEKLPVTFLIGRDGRIAGINLHGEDLEKAVARLFENQAEALAP